MRVAGAVTLVWHAGEVRQVNELGYRGASVQKIASELNVTKGSFYHHLDAKDDLVIACYKRSLDTMTAAQRRADALPGDDWHRLSSAIATLLDFQFSERGPLMRTTALSGVTPAVRSALVARSNRIARRYAGMMMDGIAQGSIRTVDPLIAAQALMALSGTPDPLRPEPLPPLRDPPPRHRLQGGGPSEPTGRR